MPKQKGDFKQEFSLLYMSLMVMSLACARDNMSPLPTIDEPSFPNSGAAQVVTVGGHRAATLLVPSSYNEDQMIPLVLSLHGYGSWAVLHDSYFGLARRVESRGFLLLAPEGMEEPGGVRRRFWDATSACCNFTGQPVDDVAYLHALVDEVMRRYKVDPKQIYVTGHSNGGFMSYRLACEARSDRFAALVSLAGSTWAQSSTCVSPTPLSVLQIHGTEDRVIRYEGATGARAYPGAMETVERWARRAGCTGAPVQEDSIELDNSLPANETDVFTYRAGCSDGVEVSLWRINGGRHSPDFNADYGDRILDFFFAHPKP